MTTLQQFEQFMRIGRQSNRTTVCPFAGGQYEDAAHAAGWFDFAISPDGLSAGTDFPQNIIQTQHRNRGAVYKLAGDKNKQTGTLSLPLVPESLGFVFGLFDVTANQLTYHTIEEYWDASLTGGAVGRRLLGVIFDSWSLDVSRESTAPLTLQLTFYFNQEVELDSGVTIPSYTFPPKVPGLYDSIQVLIDLAVSTASFGTDLEAIRSASMQFSHNVTVSDPRGHTTPSLNKTWSRHSLGIPSFSFSPRLRLDDDDYLDWPRQDPALSFMARVGIFHNAGTYAAAEAAITVAAQETSQTVNVTDATGLANGDVVLITDASKFTVGNVSNVTTGPDSFDLDRSDIAMTAEAGAIYNCAAEIRIPRLELTGPGRKAANGQDEEVSHGFTATLEAGETELYSFTGYSDDNA